MLGLSHDQRAPCWAPQTTTIIIFHQTEYKKYDRSKAIEASRIAILNGKPAAADLSDLRYFSQILFRLQFYNILA